MLGRWVYELGHATISRSLRLLSWPRARQGEGAVLENTSVPTTVSVDAARQPMRQRIEILDLVPTLGTERRRTRVTQVPLTSSELIEFRLRARGRRASRRP
jgi:hypothetical protein